MQQDLVASGKSDRVMKCRIAFDAQPPRFDLRLHLRNRAFHGFDVFVPPVGCGKLRQLDLERLASLEHVGEAAAALEKLRQGLAEAARPAEEHALAVADVDKAQ